MKRRLSALEEANQEQELLEWTQLDLAGNDVDKPHSREVSYVP